MATEAYTTEVIKLRDGTEAELIPLNITKLKKFMRLWQTHLSDVSKEIAAQEAAAGTEEAKPEDELLTSADINERQLDVFIKMCALGLEDEIKEEGTTEKKFIEYLERTLDEPTIYKILEKTGNFKLTVDDPNQNPGT